MISSSPEETLAFGQELGRAGNPSLLCFFGELGSGKTTLIKGIISGALGIDPQEVQSPTFVFLNVYGENIYHFDLYRLKNQDEFLARGFGDYLFSDGLRCIEWSERIASILPEHTSITLKHLDHNTREIILCN